MKIHILLAYAIASAPYLAAASPETARAKELFDKGRALMASGRFAEACEAFDASQKAAPATSTVFNQANCREKNGQLATAARIFGEAERATHGAVDAIGKRLNKVARERAAALEPRLSYLTINVDEQPAGLMVRRNDVELDASDWNRPLPIDGGTYTVVARLAGRDVWKQTVIVGTASATASVTVVLKPVAAVRPPVLVEPPPAPPARVEPVRVDPVPAAPSSSAEPAPAEPAPPESPRGASKTAAWIATGGSIVLLAGALGFMQSADSTYAEAKALHSMELWSSANDQRYAAQGLLAAGIGCAGIAAYLWLRSDDDAPAQVIAPVAGPGMAGVQLEGVW
jgi:hypothetical protein